jgi:glutathione S-transferase
MITVHGRRSSSNVQKVLWALAELGQPFERVTVGGGFGGVDTPQYLALNPMGLVPVMQDGDVTMVESNAIVRYLAARYGSGTLRPTEPKALAMAEQWMEWQAANIQPFVTTMFMNLVRTAPARRDGQAVKQAAERLLKPLLIADRHLDTHPYFAGDHLTMADIPLGILYWRYTHLDYAKPQLPGIDGWLKRLEARKPYQDWVMVPPSRSPEEWAANEQALR